MDVEKSVTDPRDVRSSGESYPVVEMFTSVQGEGLYVGQTTHVLRLAGCNCHCPFCDTALDKYEFMQATDIADAIAALEAKFPTGRLLLTGGEPLVHNLRPLLNALEDEYFIAVESNGLLIEKTVKETPGVMERFHWVTVSPKGFIPLDVLIQYANEVKYVIPAFEHLIHPGHFNISFQPEFGSDAAVLRCLELLKKHPEARLSVQIHKFLNLR